MQNRFAGAAMLADSRRDELGEHNKLSARICENRQKQLLLNGHSCALMTVVLETKIRFSA